MIVRQTLLKSVAAVAMKAAESLKGYHASSHKGSAACLYRLQYFFSTDSREAIGRSLTSKTSKLEPC
jgi:hypothetical protein